MKKLFLIMILLLACMAAACQPSAGGMDATPARTMTVTLTNTPRATNTPTKEPTITSSPTSTEIPLPQTLEISLLPADATEAQRQAVESGKNSETKAGLQSWWEYWMANGMPEEFKKGATITPIFDSLNQIGEDGKDSVNPWLNYAIQTPDGRIFIPTTVFGEIVDPSTATTTTPIELTGGPDRSIPILKGDWWMWQDANGQITYVLNQQGERESVERYVKLWGRTASSLSEIKKDDPLDVEEVIDTGDMQIAARIFAEPFPNTVNPELIKLQTIKKKYNMLLDYDPEIIDQLLANLALRPTKQIAFAQTQTTSKNEVGEQKPFGMEIVQIYNPDGSNSFVPSSSFSSMRGFKTPIPLYAYNFDSEVYNSEKMKKLVPFYLYYISWDEKYETVRLMDQWITHQKPPKSLERALVSTWPRET